MNWAFDLHLTLQRQSDATAASRLTEIEEAVLESDGFISVTKKSEIPEDYDFQRNDVY